MLEVRCVAGVGILFFDEVFCWLRDCCLSYTVVLQKLWVLEEERMPGVPVLCCLDHCKGEMTGGWPKGDVNGSETCSLCQF